MNKIKNYSLSFFLTKGLFLGIGLSKLFNLSGNDFLISIILGMIIGLIIIFFLNKINKTNKTIKELLLEMNIFGKILAFIIAIITIYLVYYCLMVILHFIGTMYLTKTTSWIILFPFIFVLIYIFNRGINTTIKLCNILMPISLFLIIFSFISLIPKMNITLLFPMLVNKHNNIILGSLYYGFISAIPNFFILITKNKRDNLFISYLLSNIFIILPAIATFLLLGNTLSKLHLFPEYIILRNVSFINFIENIENFISFLWIFDIVIMTSLCLFLIDDSLSIIINRSKIITKSILLIIGFIICKYFIINYHYTLFVYQSLFYILVIFFIVIILPLFIYSIRK